MDLSTLEYHFYRDICVCTTVNIGHGNKTVQKDSAVSMKKNRPEPISNSNNIPYKARPALGTIKKFKEYYFPSCDLAVSKTMIGFKGRFHSKKY